MLRRRFFPLLCCALLLLPLLACNHTVEDPAPEPAPVEPVAPNPAPEPVEPPAPVNPLTGLADGITAEKADRVPISVMVSNSYNSLPQWGISQADIVFEMIAEGRITRFLALFQDPSGLEALGSIRSARPYFIDMAQGFTPIYMHFGGSVPAYDLIGKLDYLLKDQADVVTKTYGEQVVYEFLTTIESLPEKIQELTSGRYLCRWLARELVEKDCS